jgi:hypothetical protein
VNRYLEAWARRRRQPGPTSRERAARSELNELLQGDADKRRGAAERRAEEAQERPGALERHLICRGERSVRVPPRMMGESRRSERVSGTSDPIDATAVARAALRHPELPQATLAGPDKEIGLLVARIRCSRPCVAGSADLEPDERDWSSKSGSRQSMPTGSPRAMSVGLPDSSGGGCSGSLLEPLGPPVGHLYPARLRASSMATWTSASAERTEARRSGNLLALLATGPAG